MAARKEVTITFLSFLVLILLGLGLGFFYRLPGLESRPMHTDEAILGMNLAYYWQTGRFQYDPKDFHGPALHQSAIAWGKLTGWGDPSTWTEADLRFVAVLCGLGVMLLRLPLRRCPGPSRHRPRPHDDRRLPHDGLLQPLLHHGDAALSSSSPSASVASGATPKGTCLGSSSAA